MKISACLLAALWLSACQTIDNKSKIDYGATSDLPPLEVPPDLSGIPDQGGSSRPLVRGEARAIPEDYKSSTTTSPSSSASGDRPAASASEIVLPTYSDVRLVRDGQARYLVVKGEPADVWNRVLDFFPKNGLKIQRQEPLTGMIETEWAENRAMIASDGPLTGLKALIGSLKGLPYRDKYRLRLERGVTAGTTELYLTFQGMQQVVDTRGMGGSPATQDVRTPTYWRPRLLDPEVEAEMLQRLVVHIGGDPAVAKGTTTASKSSPAAAAEPAASPSAQLVRNGDGAFVLALKDSLDRAWRRIGVSLDRGGFTVEDRDRSQGVYYVRYNDPDKPVKKAWFGSPKPNPPEQYQIRLESADKGTQVNVRNKDGALEKSKASERILSLLYEQLK